VENLPNTLSQKPANNIENKSLVFFQKLIFLNQGIPHTPALGYGDDSNSKDFKLIRVQKKLLTCFEKPFFIDPFLNWF